MVARSCPALRDYSAVLFSVVGLVSCHPEEPRATKSASLPKDLCICSFAVNAGILPGIWRVAQISRSARSLRSRGAVTLPHLRWVGGPSIPATVDVAGSPCWRLHSKHQNVCATRLLLPCPFFILHPSHFILLCPAFCLLSSRPRHSEAAQRERNLLVSCPLPFFILHPSHFILRCLPRPACDNMRPREGWCERKSQRRKPPLRQPRSQPRPVIPKPPPLLIILHPSHFILLPLLCPACDNMRRRGGCQ